MFFYRVLPPLPIALLLQQPKGNEDWKASSHFFMHTYNSAELPSSEEYSQERVTQSISTGAGCRAYMNVTTTKCSVRYQINQRQWQNLNFNCLPFMSWSASQLSSFLLPSPEMLTSRALLKDDLFTHIPFYVFEVCPLLSQGAIGRGEKNESFSRSPNTRTQAVLAVNGQSMQ